MSHLICPRGNMRTQRTLYYVFHKLTLAKGALHNWPRRTQHCSLCACTTLTLLAEQVFETCRVRACKALHIVRQEFGSVCDVLSCDDIERCRLSSSGTRRARVEVAARGGRSDLAREEVAVRTRSRPWARLRCLPTQYVTLCQYTVVLMNVFIMYLLFYLSISCHSVCVCVCMCISMSVYVSTIEYMHKHTRTRTHTHTHTHTKIHMCAHINTHAHKHTRTHNTSTYAYTHKNTHVCTHQHTRTHT